MGLCHRTERCLVYLTYMFVAGISLGCSYRVRSIDKNWNWIYISYFLITLNCIAKLFQTVVENRLSLEHRSRSRSRQRCRSHSRTRQCYPDHCLSNSRRSSTRNIHVRRYNLRGIPLCACLYEITSYLMTLWCLPCLLTQMLLDNGTVNRYATVPLTLTTFPLLVYLIDNVRENSMVDILIIGNVILLSAFSSKFECDCGLLTAIEFCVTHFILKEHRLEDFSKDICYNLGIAIYCVLSFSTISGMSIFEALGAFNLSSLKTLFENETSMCLNNTTEASMPRFYREPAPHNIYLEQLHL